MANAAQRLLMASGASTRSAVLLTANYSRTNGSPLNLQFRTDGKVYENSSGTSIPIYIWLTGSGISSDYDIRMDLSGSNVDGFSSGTVGAWENLGTARLWSRGSASWIPRFGSGIFQIRDAGSLVVLATATIGLDCEYGTGIPP